MDKSLARDYANYLGTGGTDKWDRSAASVGGFKPNGYGLYDIAGNVQEWCADWYGADYYQSTLLQDLSAKNPPGMNTGSYRVLRGGYWNFDTFVLCVACRHGFRCVSGSP